MNEEKCIFCKIVQGKIPSYKIWEDEKVFVFLDINPYALGHTLVIPKKHFRWLWDMENEEYEHLMNKMLCITLIIKALN